MAKEAVLTKADKNTEEWYTPPKYADMVRRVFGGYIDLDPASCIKANKFVKACNYYTKEQNGLNQHWMAENLFLNPPYQIMKPWCHKLHEFIFYSDSPAILLANSCTDTHWFHKLVSLNHHPAQVCFVEGRIKFLDENGQEQDTGKKPNIFVFLGAKNNAQNGLFIDEFSTIGRVVQF